MMNIPKWQPLSESLEMLHEAATFFSWRNRYGLNFDQTNAWAWKQTRSVPQEDGKVVSRPPSEDIAMVVNYLSSIVMYCLVFLVPFTKSQLYKLYPPQERLCFESIIQGIASATPRRSCPFAQRPWRSNWVGKVLKNCKLPLGLWNFDFAVHVLVLVVVVVGQPHQPHQFRWFY